MKYEKKANPFEEEILLVCFEDHHISSAFSGPGKEIGIR